MKMWKPDSSSFDRINFGFEIEMHAKIQSKYGFEKLFKIFLLIKKTNLMKQRLLHELLHNATGLVWF